MPGVKTAISIDEDLFNEVNSLASDLRVSRSKLFALAVKDYIKKQRGKKVLAQLNAAYDDSPSRQESRVSRSMRKKQQKAAQREPW